VQQRTIMNRNRNARHATGKNLARAEREGREGGGGGGRDAPGRRPENLEKPTKTFRGDQGSSLGSHFRFYKYGLEPKFIMVKQWLHCRVRVPKDACNHRHYRIPLTVCSTKKHFKRIKSSKQSRFKCEK
jgi:hypothetical protein